MHFELLISFHIIVIAIIYICGGSLELGETIVECAAREANEETGLVLLQETMSSPFLLDLRYPVPFAAVDVIDRDESGIRFHYAVIEVASRVEDPRMEPVSGDDADAAQWFSISAAVESLLTPFRNCESNWGSGGSNGIYSGLELILCNTGWTSHAGTTSRGPKFDMGNPSSLGQFKHTAGIALNATAAKVLGDGLVPKGKEVLQEALNRFSPLPRE